MIAISTAFKTAELAIEINGKTCFRSLPAECKHSENVLPMLDQMLQEIDEKLQDNDTIAVVIGPGSFTGLRIGVALAKGFCAAHPNTQVIALASLDLMAYSYTKQTQSQGFWCVLNALSDLRFAKQFDSNGNPLTEPQLIEKQLLDDLTDNIVGLSEENLYHNTIQPTAKDLLDFAKLQQSKGNFSDYHTLSPVYLRKSQAEVGLEQKKLKF